MSTVLQDDYTIPFSPKLAKILGVNEAIVIQQVHYWIEKYKDNADHQYDNRCWVYNTFEEWHEQFPFWSIATVKRTFYNLIEKKILITGWFNKKAYDHTNWYTINFEVLESLVNTDCINLIQSNVSNCTNREYQFDTSNTIDYYTKNTGIDYIENESIGCSSQSEQHKVSHIKEFIWNSEEEYQNYINNIIKNDIQDVMSEIGKTKIAGKEAYKIIKYFFDMFEHKRKMKHPRIRKIKLKEIIEGYYDIDTLLGDEDMLDVELMADCINWFFDAKRKNNYQIYIFSDHDTLMGLIGKSEYGNGTYYESINEKQGKPCYR